MKPIFRIICYYLNKEVSNKGPIAPFDFERDREWGFYHDFDKALRCVKENWTDIYENGYYNLVCIEESYEGITSFHKTKKYWFNVEYLDQDNYNVEFISECFIQKEYAHSFQTKLPTAS